LKIRTAMKLAKDAAPHCSAADGCEDRYRVWLPERRVVVDGHNFLRRSVIRARTKAELIKALQAEPEPEGVTKP
jgi:hypothetical protein